MSNDKCSRDPAELALYEAAWWRVELEYPNLSPRMLRRWRQWLELPQNREAFDSLETVWRAVHSPRKERSSRSTSCTPPVSARVRRPGLARTSAGAGTQRTPLIGYDDAEMTGLGVGPVRCITKQAAYWYVRCSGGSAMSASTRRMFLEWLRRAPEHVAELARIMTVDILLARHCASAGINCYKGPAVESDIPFPLCRLHGHPSTIPPPAQRDQASPGGPTLHRKLAAVAAFALPLLLPAVVWRPANDTVSTAAGEWKHLTLADGTVVHVGPRTRLDIEFNSQMRVVYLYNGEIVFQVAKDSMRPFMVNTPLTDATALGTRFGISVDHGVTTTVSEGMVMVTSRDASNGTISIAVPKDHQLRVVADRPQEPDLINVDAARKLDWANGWLTFDGETIGEAVREFNRRNVMQIAIDQPDIAARQLPSRYRVPVKSPEQFLKLISSQTGLTFTKDRSRGVMRLSCRSGEAPTS